MRTRALFLRIGVCAATVIVTLSMGGPMTQAAAPPIIIDDASPATDCGKYTGQDTQPDLSVATAGLTTGTILVCPGTYSLSSMIYVPNASKLTIKRALTGPGSRPIITVPIGAMYGIQIQDSTSVTIDGLILDARGIGAVVDYVGITFFGSTGAIRNTTLLGPAQANVYSILVGGSGSAKMLPITITGNHIAGFSSGGIYISGSVKATIVGNFLDGEDGGRVMFAPKGVWFDGQTADPLGPTGVVGRNTIISTDEAVHITEASKISVTSNTMFNNHSGVIIETQGLYRGADYNKVIKNTIAGIMGYGRGVYITDNDASNTTILKTVISNNTFVAYQYTPSGSMPVGIEVDADVPALTTVTATISKNTFTGFPVSPIPLFIVNVDDNANLKMSGNDHNP